MYAGSDAHRLDEVEAFAFIERYGFATVVGPDRFATPVPLVADRARGTLSGHLARANPHADLIDAAEVIAIFQGPHAYVSPTWLHRAPAVPTWNYGAVHVRGTAEVLDRGATREQVLALTSQYEQELVERGDILTEEYTERLLAAVTGFVIHIDSIEGKLKLGQEKSTREQHAVVAGLSRAQRPDTEGLLQLMRDARLGLGED